MEIKQNLISWPNIDMAYKVNDRANSNQGFKHF